VNRIWRAHVAGISCISNIPKKRMILTSSNDMTIRLWTFEGTFVGIFGAGTPWRPDFPKSYQPLPQDLVIEIERERIREAAKKTEIKIQDNIIKLLEKSKCGLRFMRSR
jgi:WD40 repeat protein